jgi:hypothetical protein
VVAAGSYYGAEVGAIGGAELGMISGGPLGAIIGGALGAALGGYGLQTFAGSLLSDFSNGFTVAASSWINTRLNGLAEALNPAVHRLEIRVFGSI